MSFSPPSGSSMMFSGLMSRWMMPARCSAASALRELDGDGESGRERNLRPAQQAPFERLAFVERQHAVQAAAPLGGRLQRFGDERTAHVRGDPHLAQQRRAQQCIEAGPRLRKLEHHFAAAPRVARAEHAHVLAIGEHLAELVVVDDVAADRRAGAGADRRSRVRGRRSCVSGNARMSSTIAVALSESVRVFACSTSCCAVSFGAARFASSAWISLRDSVPCTPSLQRR